MPNNAKSVFIMNSRRAAASLVASADMINDLRRERLAMLYDPSEANEIVLQDLTDSAALNNSYPAIDLAQYQALQDAFDAFLTAFNTVTPATPLWDSAMYATRVI